MKTIYRYKTHSPNGKPTPLGEEVEEFVASFDDAEKARHHLVKLEKEQGTMPDNKRWHYQLRYDVIRAKARR